jgi:hypothetical protein
VPTQLVPYNNTEKFETASLINFSRSLEVLSCTLAICKSIAETIGIDRGIIELERIERDRTEAAMKTTDFGNKPFGTRIQLTKSGNFFEIYIPPIGFHPVILFIAPFAVLWNWGIAQWVLLASLVPFPGNIVAMAFSIPFWMAGGSLVYICLFTLFGKTYFRIDRNEVSLVKTLFGQKISRERPEPKREITKLIFTRKHPSPNNNEDTLAALKIEIGAKSFQIGGSQGGIESEAEVEWLAFEVSEWLDKPLKIIGSSR